LYRTTHVLDIGRGLDRAEEEVVAVVLGGLFESGGQGFALGTLREDTDNDYAARLGERGEVLGLNLLDGGADVLAHVADEIVGFAGSSVLGDLSFPLKTSTFISIQRRKNRRVRN
jgi:hypothetical protein